MRLVPRFPAPNQRHPERLPSPRSGDFLAAAQTVSRGARPGPALMPRVGLRSEAVNVDHGQLVYPSLNRFAVVMSLDKLAPVGGRASCR